MNAAPAWLEKRRDEAAENFRLLGVPHRRIEEWKYSDLQRNLNADTASAIASAAWTLSAIPDGVELIDLAGENYPEWVQRHLGQIAARNGMEAASLGFSRAGLALRVRRNTIISTPLRLTYSGSGHARLLLVLEDGASLTLVEQNEAGEALRNLGSEILLGQNAQLSHIILSSAAPGLRISTLTVHAARDAKYIGHIANFGAQLSRYDVAITLQGQGAETRLSSVSALSGENHADITSHVTHAACRTTSFQLVKHVAGDHARGIYQGRVTVAAGANGSDSVQSAKGLLLGRRAEINLKPELEIFADDVKCAHGATIGDLDAEPLFYLRSRGIPESEARNLLIRAFLQDAVQEVADETLRSEIWLAVEQALSAVMENKS